MTRCNQTEKLKKLILMMKKTKTKSNNIQNIKFYLFNIYNIDKMTKIYIIKNLLKDYIGNEKKANFKNKIIK